MIDLKIIEWQTSRVRLSIWLMTFETLDSSFAIQIYLSIEKAQKKIDFSFPNTRSNDLSLTDWTRLSLIKLTTIKTFRLFWESEEFFRRLLDCSLWYFDLWIASYTLTNRLMDTYRRCQSFSFILVMCSDENIPKFSNDLVIFFPAYSSRLFHGSLIADRRRSHQISFSIVDDNQLHHHDHCHWTIRSSWVLRSKSNRLFCLLVGGFS